MPTIRGGHNWSARSYSLETRLFYFGSADGCELFYRHKQEFYEGQWFQASTNSTIPDEPHTGAVLAVDPTSGRTVWRCEMLEPSSAGMLATAGGLVFTGNSQGYLIALDARTGKPLWHFQTGGSIKAPPNTYTLNGKQQIAVAAGASIVTFALVN
jgi:alcohol dehydrogenase (cytochrome c)